MWKNLTIFFGDQLAIFLFSIQILSKIVDSFFPSKMLNSTILSIFCPKQFRSVLRDVLWYGWQRKWSERSKAPLRYLLAPVSRYIYEENL